MGRKKEIPTMKIGNPLSHAETIYHAHTYLSSWHASIRMDTSGRHDSYDLIDGKRFPSQPRQNFLQLVSPHLSFPPSSALSESILPYMAPKRKLNDGVDLEVDAKWNDPDDGFSLISSDNVRFIVSKYHLQSSRQVEMVLARLLFLDADS